MIDVLKDVKAGNAESLKRIPLKLIIVGSQSDLPIYIGTIRKPILGTHNWDVEIKWLH